LLLLDENAVHHRDLARGATETQCGNPDPDPEGLAERNTVRFGPGGRRRKRAVRGAQGERYPIVTTALAVGQVERCAHAVESVSAALAENVRARAIRPAIQIAIRFMLKSS
jgi:hypothetical protein